MILVHTQLIYLTDALRGLFNILFGQTKEGVTMEMMSPEKVMELGRKFSGLFLSNLSTEERLGLVKDIPVNDRLELLNDIPPELIESYLNSRRSYVNEV